MIYILQFSRPLGNENHSAQFYMGYCSDRPVAVQRRLALHRAGMGAAITRAAAQRGIQMDIVLVMPGSRDDERRLKKQKNHRRIVHRHLKSLGYCEGVPL